MVVPTAGEVVLVPFLFSDLSQSKVRPAVCLADASRGDWVLCQITSTPYGDPSAVPLDAPDFASGGPPGGQLCSARKIVHRTRRVDGPLSGRAELRSIRASKIRGYSDIQSPHWPLTPNPFHFSPAFVLFFTVQSQKSGSDRRPAGNYNIRAR